MQKHLFVPLALAGALTVPTLGSAQFADAVVTYTSGTGFQPGYTTPASALGEPSRVTPGTFGGPVHPFNAPYLASQLVSLGTGGSLTVQFNAPIFNNPANPRTRLQHFRQRRFRHHERAGRKLELHRHAPDRQLALRR
jgi:hypothetical protein